jgi:hypothetical protein
VVAVEADLFWSGPCHLVRLTHKVPYTTSGASMENADKLHPVKFVFIYSQLSVATRLEETRSI